MSPAIRPAESSDAEPLAQLSLEVWDETYQGIIDAATLRRRHDEPADVRQRRWASRIACERVFVVSDGAIIVGYVRASGRGPTPGQEAQELLSLYVLRRYWCRGLGSRLLDTAITQPAAQLWLFEENARALAFYGKRGFSLDGRSRLDPPYGVELHLTRVEAG
ncbi:GNAT family N-acetyltransferase [Agreia sp. COWG]|uniref:GNAT family N-acetyltransferase n=1 Tax=Agreia sp. COWG TaxID=2773266 RepID=UPI001927A100|nr:GNAT family N-acetyltransferase [Agreia sp. COWG]CAD6009057.1 Ribosomal protein S18 acetylase RimI [Agreia sp. COWG]